jgi:hypothetical protein
MLEKNYKCNIDAVELDERMLEIAKIYFNLSDKVKISGKFPQLLII